MASSSSYGSNARILPYLGLIRQVWGFRKVFTVGVQGADGAYAVRARPRPNPVRLNRYGVSPSMLGYVDAPRTRVYLCAVLPRVVRSLATAGGWGFAGGCGQMPARR